MVTKIAKEWTERMGALVEAVSAATQVDMSVSHLERPRVYSARKAVCLTEHLEELEAAGMAVLTLQATCSHS